MTEQLRPDLQAVADMVSPESLVLDIGCGKGELLNWLVVNKQVQGRGIDLNQQKVNQAIASGLSVVHGNADQDLIYYPEHAYDFVISSQSIQAMKDPKAVLEQLARVGRQVIVSVPNFGHWKNRLYLGLRGRMPVTKKLTYQWYETPNIHFCTIVDFIDLCREMQLNIVRQMVIDESGRSRDFHGRSAIANLSGTHGVFLIEK